MFKAGYKVYRWKQKNVSEKVYFQRLKQRETRIKTAEANRLKKEDENTSANLSCQEALSEETNDFENIEDSTPKPSILKHARAPSACASTEPCAGRRIVELMHLGNEMWCQACKDALSFQFIINEHRRGLGSVLSIRCHKCLLINIVTTGKQHPGPHGRVTRFDVNTKVVMGIVDAGMGHTHLNKVLACANVPTIDFKTFKRYGVEVGTETAKLASQSCSEATALERDLTIKNVEEVTSML